ncbi:MAG: hypothetical protein R3335_12870, partial [Anaerolineales bacterium]|nr:hypothetical protein [Anaerolineales bacterium]
MNNSAPSHILKTKLNPPLNRSGLVPRPRLIDTLNLGLERKLTLVTAPAGYGKTTILGHWISNGDFTTTWLSLDEGDNDPARFLAYVI